MVTNADYRFAYDGGVGRGENRGNHEKTAKLGPFGRELLFLID